MQARQKHTIESYQRVQTFLETHPVAEPLSYAEPKRVLDEVVANLTDHSTTQASGSRLSQADLRKLQRLVEQLREHHLRPIVAIARANAIEMPGIERALKMPPANASVLKLLAESEAIGDAVKLYEPAFVKNGRPADFLAQLSATIEAVRQAGIGRAKNVGRRVGAKAGLTQELKRGRRAVEMLDSIVRVGFEGNDVVLATWRVARRVRALPGAGRNNGSTNGNGTAAATSAGTELVVQGAR